MKEQEFFEKMAAVWLELSALKEAAETIIQDMAQLEQAGMTNATIHIRSDNGAMELLHHSGSEYKQKGGRRREYVGKKPEAQEEARCKHKRYQSYQSLKHELASKQEEIRSIEYQIGRLEMAALGKQAKLFSKMGTEANSRHEPGVPTDWNWLTPKMVIDYFKHSPILAVVAEDVEDALAKVEWAESEKLAA